MSAKQQLRPEEREFFSVVAHADFTNPFSDERAEVDSELVGNISPVPYEERSQRVSAGHD